MNNIKTAIETLQEFAKKTDRKIKIIDNPTDTLGLNPGKIHGKIAIIRDKEDESIFFIGYEDSRRDSLYSLYTGVFTSISEHCQSRFSIVKKDWLDRLSFRIGYQKVFTGVSLFDKKTSITSNNPPMVHRLLSDRDSQTAVLEAMDIQDGLSISINELVTDQIPELANKSQLSLYLFKDWILDNEKIDKMFEAVRTLKARFE